MSGGFVKRWVNRAAMALPFACIVGANAQTTDGMQSAGGMMSVAAPATASAATLASAALASLNASATRTPSGDAHYESATPLGARSAVLPVVPSDLNEQVIEIPMGATANGAGSTTLETTIFKPSGSGPFPLVVFNHGKERGDPREQPRSRPLAFAREFVRHGYVVVAPNRRGFAHSGGRYIEHGCDVKENGLSQALDVAATIAFMAQQPYVDAAHIVVAGVSHGGLTTIAYGEKPQPGVRGLLNFAGGLRQEACPSWQANLSRAFGAYGDKVRLPSLWFYGDNDSFWSPPLIAQMYGAFVHSGARAQLVDVGRYKDDAHRLVADCDGVALWWPSAAGFLAQVGMPASVRYRIADPVLPPASGYASIDAIEAVPFVNEVGRKGYQTFLKQYPTRAFAVSDSGAWSWAEGGDNPVSVALANCQKHSRDPCHLYAVNHTVVWAGR